MNYSFKATSKQSLEELDKQRAEEIIELIEEVAEQGFNHDKVKVIKDRNGDWVYRIKVDEETPIVGFSPTILKVN
jgi:mRNA-degrading endonuclease RelE of RelBE toxin-antitoxin system